MVPAAPKRDTLTPTVSPLRGSRKRHRVAQRDATQGRNLAKTLQLNVRVDEDLVVILQREATRQRRTVSDVVRLVLTDTLERKPEDEPVAAE